MSESIHKSTLLIMNIGEGNRKVNLNIITTDPFLFQFLFFIQKKMLYGHAKNDLLSLYNNNVDNNTITTADVYYVFLCASLPPKCVTHTISFNSHSFSMRYYYCSYPQFKVRNQDTESVSNRSKEGHIANKWRCWICKYPISTATSILRQLQSN